MALLGSHCITALPPKPDRHRRGAVAGVYVIQNLSTAKVYVGGSTDIYRRWIKHLFALRHGDGPKSLQQDWDTFGPADFTFNVVHEIEDRSSSLDFLVRTAEQRWINQLAPVGLYNRMLTVIRPSAYLTTEVAS